MTFFCKSHSFPYSKINLFLNNIQKYYQSKPVWLSLVTLFYIEVNTSIILNNINGPSLFDFLYKNIFSHLHKISHINYIQ